MKRTQVIFALFFLFDLIYPASGQEIPGSDTITELYSPLFLGAGGFVTSTGGASASVINPASGGGAQLLVIDGAVLGLAGGGGGGVDITAAGLLPTKYAVFGASLHFLSSNSPGFPLGWVLGGNFSAAKELYPGMSVGAGLNYGFGEDWTLALDLGFRWNMGRLGPFGSFTWAAALSNIGKSYPQKAFTLTGGVSAELWRLRGDEGQPDPVAISAALDLGLPGFVNLTGKFGVNFTIYEFVNLYASMGFNVRDIIDGKSAPPIPSLGVTVRFALDAPQNAAAERAGEKAGELGVRVGAKPLPGGVWAFGPALRWTAGVPDRTPPAIAVDYPQAQWISPNNDGVQDALEFFAEITDQRYVMEWGLEIRDDAGETVRSYRNKERRVENEGWQDVVSRLLYVSAGVEIPSPFRWDGSLDSGGAAPDGLYSFSLWAKDDNGNEARSGDFFVNVDSTRPLVHIEPMSEADKLFSPDGDGHRDSLELRLSGSEEELWDAGIYSPSGVKIRDFNIENGSPGPTVWDGAGDDGRIVQDGVYAYRISARDRAGNTAFASVENIIVNTLQPTVSLRVLGGYFSPNGDGVNDTLTFNTSVSLQDGITGWAVTIRNASGAVVRSLEGVSPVPSIVEFDGMDSAGQTLPEGRYQGRLSVNYRNGYESTAASPYFILDITAPWARVSTGYGAFSPNNDGIQDTMIFWEEASREVAWTGEVRRGDEALRSFRFNGIPDPYLAWDGRDNTGRLAPDGDYTYRLFATDPAGNYGESAPVAFTLSTADTPAMISAGAGAFSPNGDGVMDSIALLPVLQVQEGLASYRVDVLDSGKNAVRTFSGTGRVPASITWDGRDSSGKIVPDGPYTAALQGVYSQGNRPAAQSQVFVVDTKAPDGKISLEYTVFSPNGDGRRDSLPILVSTQGDDEWTAEIRSGNREAGSGEKLNLPKWAWKGAAPPIAWNGTDEAGNLLPDGDYIFALASRDAAGNVSRLQSAPFTLDARTPRAFFTADTQGIVEGPVHFSVILDPKDGISDWSIAIRDENGALYRNFSGGAPPESLTWHGEDEAGNVREGRYRAAFTVDYDKGDRVLLEAGPITVDHSGPRLGLSLSPEYFSPDNDGIDDELIIALTAEDSLSPVASWRLEIREPVAPHNAFYLFEGQGAPPARIIWDGRSGKGELVQSATDYPWVFEAQDSMGNSSVIEGAIGIDVLVIRDGGQLRMQVPSIIFREYAADFENLPAATAANNLRVLQRIAQILNKFREYRVKVEGHANPVKRTVEEEQYELQPLSEARARAVVEKLVGFGVERGRLTYVGLGATRPVVQYADRDNWWKNRRVEFILLK